MGMTLCIEERDKNCSVKNNYLNILYVKSY